MPRTGRLHIAGGYYHVIGRGLERRTIFADDYDKSDILTRLGRNLPRYNSRCLAWAIMPNHYHFLIQVNETPLSKLLASVLGGFALGYNRRHNRCGYVFQNRYTSILCDKDSYVLELIRYIHLNPLRAGLLKDISSLKHYRWTGHAGVLGEQQQHWHDIDAVLSLFGTQRSSAKKRYHSFIQAGLKSTKRDLSGGGVIRSYGGWDALSVQREFHKRCIGDERILGNSAFVKATIKKQKLSLLVRSERIGEGWNLECLTQYVCSLCNIELAEITIKTRNDSSSLAKALLCYWGTTELGLSTRELAYRLRISQPAVSKWVYKGRSRSQEKSLKLPKLPH